MKTAALKLAKWISETSDFNITELLDLAGEVRTAWTPGPTPVPSAADPTGLFSWHVRFQKCRESTCKSPNFDTIARIFVSLYWFLFCHLS